MKEIFKFKVGDKVRCDWADISFRGIVVARGKYAEAVDALGYVPGLRFYLIQTEDRMESAVEFYLEFDHQ